MFIYILIEGIEGGMYIYHTQIVYHIFIENLMLFI